VDKEARQGGMMAQEGRELAGKKYCLLWMDGAGWHKSKDLLLPKNIEIIYLPPHSPELKPLKDFGNI
jgi:hypothetical protein